jgi:hypothetical protein
MMRKGHLSREEAIARVGQAAVDKVERENCYFTNRCQCDGDTSVEFSACVDAIENDDHVFLIAYYFQPKEAVDAVDDLDMLDWEIDGFEITD